MRITDFIRETIIGKDTTLSMFDIAGHIYKTRSPSKSQRVAINRAITTVADDINIVATHSFDKATRLVFNPLSDKSTLIACEKRKRNDRIQHSDSKVWKELSKIDGGQSFGKIDTRIKLLAAKARDPENAQQIEKDYEIERDAYFREKKSVKLENISPTIEDAERALTTLYDYARSVSSTSSPDKGKGVEMVHDGNLLKFTFTPI